MDLKVFMMVFGTVFIAELGDKTQLATVLFATNKDVSKATIFMAASLALIATSALGVVAGTFISQHFSDKSLNIVAGVGFITIGTWILIRALSPVSG